MKYLYTRLSHYNSYINEYNTNRLDKGIKIISTESKRHLLSKSFELNEEEIFESPLDTNYTISNKDNKLTVIFSTTSDTEYRLDIFSIIENDDIVNHLAFSINNPIFDKIPTNQKDFDNYNLEYHKLTSKHEVIELLNRIHFILKDLVSNSKIENNFCIGGTEIIEKNNIYEYFLKVVVGNDGFTKKNSDIYPNIGWGLYFKI
jgi:hypothetical protein